MPKDSWKSLWKKREPKDTSVTTTTEKDQTPYVSLKEKPVQYATAEPGVFTLEPHDKKYLEAVIEKSNHSDFMKKILRERLEQRAKEFPRWPGNMNMNTRAMFIEGPFSYDRNRLGPYFTDEDRAWRAKYLKSL